MMIAQITDTHITEPDTLLAGRIDSAAALARAIERLLAFDVRPAAVLLTGDLTDRGTAAAYSALRRVLSRLDMPTYAIPGNHDRREAMRAAFEDCPWMPAQHGSRLCYRADIGRYALIALDSLVEGQDFGELGEYQLGWLQEQLRQARGQPTLIMVHHPPTHSGIAAMDAMKLVDSDAFGAVVAAHPNIERILCGHLHRSMHLRWRGTVVSVPVSSVEQLHLAFSPGAPLGTVQEPPGLQLHFDHPVDGLITHTVPVGTFAGPYFDD